MIIHDVSEINLFDQIIIMAKVDEVGRLAFAGTPEDGRRYFQVENLIQAYDMIKRSPERFRTCIHNRRMPDGRWILLPCKAKNCRNPDGFQDFLTRQDSKGPLQAAFDGCEYRFL